MVWELATVWVLDMLPPLARFFIALFLVLVITIGAVLFTYWVDKGGE